MADEHYGERLGLIRLDQFQNALNAFDLGTFLAAQFADSGLFGQCVFVQSSKGDFVLRGYPHYDGQLEKERFFAKLIHERTKVPGPWPYLISDDQSIFGWQFAFMPALSGTQIGAGDAFRNASAEDKLGIAIAVAATLSELHEIEFGSDGEYNYELDDIVAHKSSLGDRVLEEILSRSDIAIGSNKATNMADRQRIEAFYAERSGAFDLPHRSTYVHHDIKPNNMVGQKGLDGKWKITGLFDLMEGYIGDGEEDLPRFAADLMLYSDELLSAFLDNYRERRPPSEGYEDRYEVYLLRDRLVIWSYGQRNGLWYPRNLKFRDWIEQYIQNF